MYENCSDGCKTHSNVISDSAKDSNDILQWNFASVCIFLFSIAHAKNEQLYVMPANEHNNLWAEL